MKDKIKYYVEIYEKDSDEPYILQSIWFDSYKEAKSFAKNIAYLDNDFAIDINKCVFYIDENGNEEYEIV